MDQTAEGTASAGDDAISDTLRLAVGGDRDAIAEIVDWLSPLMTCWARARIGPQAAPAIVIEDLIQDVWLRILPELPRLRPHPSAPGRLSPALMAIARRMLRNRVIDLRRAATRRRLRSLSGDTGEGMQVQVVTPSSGPLSKAARSDRRRLIEAALAQCSARERALYVDRIFEESSLSELAERFGMTPAAVIKARQRVRARLAAILSPQLIDDLEP